MVVEYLKENNRQHERIDGSKTVVCLAGED